MAELSSQGPDPKAVAGLEPLIRLAVFQQAKALVEHLLQQAANQIDQAYRPRPGERFKGRQTLQVQGMFGHFPLHRNYYHDPAKGEGHFPTDAALGLEGSCTPALARLICQVGAQQPTYLQAEENLEQTGGISVSARQIQRVVQRVGETLTEPEHAVWRAVRGVWPGEAPWVSSGRRWSSEENQRLAFPLHDSPFARSLRPQ
jgi:hypothetical protein